MFTDVSEVLAASIIRVMITLMMEAAQRNNPEDSHLHTCHHDNLKSQNEDSAKAV
jgi:hypothetical protein